MSAWYGDRKLGNSGPNAIHRQDWARTDDQSQQVGARVVPTDVAHRLGGADGVERSIGDQDLLALGGAGNHLTHRVDDVAATVHRLRGGDHLTQLRVGDVSQALSVDACLSRNTGEA